MTKKMPLQNAAAGARSLPSDPAPDGGHSGAESREAPGQEREAWIAQVEQFPNPTA